MELQTFEKRRYRKRNTMAKRKAKTWSRKFETNILKVYNRATDAEREQGLYWYATANKDAQAIAERHNVPLKHVAGVIAALSPGLEWGLNLLQADELISAFKTDKPRPSVGVYGKKNVNKAYEILQGQDPLTVLPKTGPKTRAFYSCIESPENSFQVTIDRHAKCLAYWRLTDREAISAVRPAEYEHLARHYNVISERLGLMPHQLQAITWVAWKRIVRDSTFLTGGGNGRENLYRSSVSGRWPNRVPREEVSPIDGCRHSSNTAQGHKSLRNSGRRLAGLWNNGNVLPNAIILGKRRRDLYLTFLKIERLNNAEVRMENETCVMCGGPLALLGKLGNLTWVRCINCGAEQSVDREENDEAE